MSISIHGPSAVQGTWNVFGTRDGLFNLQGNLTLAEIKALRDQCNAVLKASCTCLTDQRGDGCTCQSGRHPDDPTPCPACDCPVHGDDDDS